MKTAILLSVLLASCQYAHAQDRVKQIQSDVEMHLFDDPCGEGAQSLAVAHHTTLNEDLKGCWYSLNGEAHIVIRNGNKLQDYRYLESSFKAVE